jgi:GTP-binding protein
MLEQLINHFIVNSNWYLVDLPGYGYARVSKKAKKTFQKFITNYFEKREQLVLAFVLIDCRHEPQPVDMDFMQYLGEKEIPFHIAFTKSDKLRPKALERNIAAYSEKMLETWEEMPPYFTTSASNSAGRDELLNYIENINIDFHASAP